MDIETTQRDPSWIFSGNPRERVVADSAASFLASLPKEDRDLFVLSHGLGLDFGTVAYAMDMDTSIVSWRLRRALMASEIAGEPGELERGVAALFADESIGEWNAETLLAAMPADVRERLDARQASNVTGAAGDEAHSGLGIGAVGLILLAMIAFIAYGVIRDEDPMWRGKARVRQAQFEQARDAFRELGNLPEARAWTAITWLAEGNFEKANEVLAEPAAELYLGLFSPMTGVLETLDVEVGSTAALPRGLISLVRPEFAFTSGAVGVLSVEQGAVDDGTTANSPRRLALSGAPAGIHPTRNVPYPRRWAPLEAGTYVWIAPGAPPNRAAFTVMSKEQRQEIQRHSWQRLSHSIPLHARMFLRGHYYLYLHLYTQAGNQFRDLALAFPDEPYPRQMLDRISAALGVDPTAFLR
jgi:hypothetical protein